jgi:hypothetical protein
MNGPAGVGGQVGRKRARRVDAVAQQQSQRDTRTQRQRSRTARYCADLGSNLDEKLTISRCCVGILLRQSNELCLCVICLQIARNDYSRDQAPMTNTTSSHSANANASDRLHRCRFVRHSSSNHWSNEVSIDVRNRGCDRVALTMSSSANATPASAVVYRSIFAFVFFPRG